MNTIEQVNQIITQAFSSEAVLLSKISTYLHQLKGKQLRPILCLQVAEALGLEKFEELIKIAAGIELIHMATILHDDIIDNSDLRRKQESANKKFGINPTLLTGDFLLVRAFGLCGQLPKEIVAATETACVALTEGEILETALYQEKHDLESVIRIARKKTAALFSLATFSAGFISGASKEKCQYLFDFGENLGIAFQILDDILDVSANEAAFGKKIGTDLREHKPSVINILWLNSGSNLAKKLLKPDAPDIEKMLLEIQNSDIPATAKKLAIEYANKAELALKNAFSECSSSDYEQLKSLIRFAIERVR